MLISSSYQSVNAVCYGTIKQALISHSSRFDMWKQDIFFSFPVPSKHLKMCEKRHIFSLSVNVSVFFFLFFYVVAGLQFGCREGNYFCSTIFDVIAGDTLTMRIQYN